MPFEMIGVTAADGSVPAGTTVSVHDPEHGWGPWISLADTEGDHGPDPGTAEAEAATASTDPVWVGEADGYRVSVLDEAADENVQVHLVSEGNRPAVAVEEDEAGGAGAADVNTRASWSAAPYNGTPSYAAGLERAVIHHTVNANSYSSADVPAMIRAIQAYHQDVNGWYDIGYNFIVDRFGRTWEGRSGSIANATVGAHTAGANTGSVGVAFLGDGRYDSPPATVNAAGALLSWKMPAHGATPTQNNVLGHRNLGATNCPGGLLYADLDAIVLAAQADDLSPTATIASPIDGATFDQDQAVNAAYTCADETNGSGLASCVGDVAVGAAIDTTTLGPHDFTVTGTDNAGNEASVTHSYTVVANTPPNKDACKNDSWESYTDDEGTPFTNQGDCVSYVATGGTNKAQDGAAVDQQLLEAGALG